MDNQFANLLLKEIPPHFATAEKWYSDELTQGNSIKYQAIKRIKDSIHQPVYVIKDENNTKPKEENQEKQEKQENHEEQATNNVELAPEPITKDKNNIKREYKKKDTELSFVDFIAKHIDDMFSIYPYETKRDIRQYTKGQLIDWVSKNARTFFGPATSRAISACIRNQHENMADVERFAEFVSFLLNVPVQAGTKIVVWHGFKENTRVPVFSLRMKPHNIYVTDKL